MAAALYLGLMSGTSQDGVDAVMVEIDGGRLKRVLAHHSTRYPAALRQRLLRLARDQHALTLHDYCELDQEVARTFVRAARTLLKKNRIPARRITALGSHGQTVFHSPQGRVRSSVQLGDPNLIARLTGITTVADFRRADMAAGGQGAPLVPAFHHALFSSQREPRVVVNIGGIANITVLPNARADSVLGFDTGPGNALMDEWSQRHRHEPYDRNGRWAAFGALNENLLQALLNDPFFRQRPPKSTGRDYFNLEWASRRFPGLRRLNPAVVQHTFAELTACSVARAIERDGAGARRVLVCGGGARNAFLMERLRARLASRSMETTEALGLDAQSVEAAAFAWLAMLTMQGLPGSLPRVTGAQRAVVLGGIYRA